MSEAQRGDATESGVGHRGSGGTDRRRFLLGAAGIAGWGWATATLTPAATGARAPSVAVLGGGVAGMTVAHELIERGFAVTVYERRALGGKARSMAVPGSGRDGRRDLPGEHGFRFFAGVYHNLPDTLRRIPFPGNPNGVHDNLVDATEILLSRAANRADLSLPIPMSRPTPASLLDQLGVSRLLDQLRAFVETNLHLPPPESLLFARRLLVYLTSGDRRRFGQWEFVAWPEFIRARGKSQDYQRIIANGPTRALSATRTDDASSHTVGLVLEALYFNAQGRGAEGAPDRVLNLPTNEAWIDPWVQHLRALGVEFRVGWEVEHLSMDGGRIGLVGVRDPVGSRQRISTDYVVCALPVEHARRVWNEDLLAADPQLRAATRLRTEWMTGVQFYLRAPAKIAHGHVYYVDSPWALTSVSQAQFWPDRDWAADYGDGTVRDCISAIISDWDTPGVLYGRPARELTPDRIAEEVWTQLKQHLNDTGRATLDDGALHSWFLDPGVTGLGGPNPYNADELAVQPVGSWQHRPTARTEIANFFLAGDYLKVDINAACMEGASAGARMAVNALLDAASSAAPRAAVYGLYRAPEFEQLRSQDDERYAAGLPNLLDID